ncbi:Uncharacterised protein [Klebsiella pneumoniae]|nr:Uncharacterised protein [Klebsiella pneumoniae]
MSLDPRIARTDNHHIRFQLIGQDNHLIANIATAHIKMAGVFRKPIFLHQLAQLFLSGIKQMVFHLSGIRDKSAG